MASTRLSRAENTSPRLEAYQARTQGALDLFALCTLWIIAVPIANFGPGSEVTAGGLALRLSISVVYGIDMAVRSMLAPQPFRYLRTHPLGLFAVIMPPVRVLFSLRLITSLFRRGHIERFLAAALLLLLNGVLIVYFYERNAAGANITTIGDALWWAAVTVTTVGYGDLYPITVGGRVVAVGIMAIGLLTLAVITAQVSSSFVEQSGRRRAELAAQAAGAQEDGAQDEDAAQLVDGATTVLSAVPGPADQPIESRHLDAVHDRLDRIEAMLRDLSDAERLPRTDD
jgi:voltage-gated potassium channel